MKYIKYFENIKNLKKFILEEHYLNKLCTIWTIWEVLDYDKEKKLYWIIKRYIYDSKTGNIESLPDTFDQPCDEKDLLTGIVKQSDNIQDLLDEYELKIAEMKYNL